ncbi:monocyte chemotactic protein 1B-like [Etheostoma cragini]|uniref:monocyte chemotactic protein 1B-like n=1 Tax=Etheostoma cragini TaxID=417921 RepID=UPI00155E4EDD|nr:monocyte chemotactic protein 1B-like [Etheostoma cragini]XP_034744727.1 monocyte chemotactic protein 1B-like [Etheostoma cragini]
MRFPTLFILLILSCLCLALAQTSFDDCCLKYVKRMSKGTQLHAVKYRHQVTDGGCNIHAVIFTMRKGVEFCTDPKDAWVKDLITKIDEKRQNKGRNRKHRKTPWSPRG